MVEALPARMRAQNALPAAGSGNREDLMRRDPAVAAGTRVTAKQPATAAATHQPVQHQSILDVHQSDVPEARSQPIEPDAIPAP